MKTEVGVTAPLATPKAEKYMEQTVQPCQHLDFRLLELGQNNCQPPFCAALGK